MFSRDGRSSLFFCFLVFCFLVTQSFQVSLGFSVHFILFYFILLYSSIIVSQTPIRNRQDATRVTIDRRCQGQFFVIVAIVIRRYRLPSIVSSSPWLVAASIHARRDVGSSLFHFLFFSFFFCPLPRRQQICARERKERKTREERDRERERWGIDEENKLSNKQRLFFFYKERDTSDFET